VSELEVRVIGAPEAAGQAVIRVAELLDVDRHDGPRPSRKTPGHVLHYLHGRLPALPVAAPEVEPEAALALLEVAARELRRAAEDLGPALVPHSVLFLARGFERICDMGQVDALEVEMAHRSAYQARRCDMAEAFKRLNPEFGEVHQGCWSEDIDVGGYDRRRQQRAQRRELKLSMGERFAAMLAPAVGGEAA
jgi:hypothetical protein